MVLPYVPASSSQIENVMKALLNGKSKGKKLIDLGSGDGRIVYILVYIFLSNSK